MPRDGNKEARIQREILEFLWAVAPQVLPFHVPNGAYLAGTEEQRKRAAYRLKWQGLVPGIPDLVVLIPGGHVLLIEVKAHGNDLEPEQENIQAWCIKWGVPRITARCVNDVRLALAQFNIQSREAA